MQTTEEPGKGGLPTARQGGGEPPRKAAPFGGPGAGSETRGSEAEQRASTERKDEEESDDVSEELEAELFASEEDEAEEAADEGDEDEEALSDEEAEEEIELEAEGATLELVPEPREASAIDLLIRQHREVDALFDEIDNASDKAKRTKEKLVETLVAKLDLHARIEEKVFYPGVKEIDEELVLESYEEHDLMRFAARKLAKTAPDDEAFDARLSTSREIVEHHVQEEETELFPEVRRSLDDEDLAKLGQRMLEMAKRGEATPRVASSRGSGKRREATSRKQAQPKAASKKRSSKAKSTKSRAKAGAGSKGGKKTASRSKAGSRSRRGPTSRRAARH